MSTWFRSYIVYGVKIPYEEFEKLMGDKVWEDDNLRIENNPEGIGWGADGMNGNWAFYGKIVHNGSDNGSDSPLGGNGEVEKLKLLTPHENRIMRGLVEEQLGEKYSKLVAYYVVGEYS